MQEGTEVSGRGSFNAFQVLTAQAGLYFLQAGPACLPASHTIPALEEEDTTTLLEQEEVTNTQSRRQCSSLPDTFHPFIRVLPHHQAPLSTILTVFPESY